MKSICKIFLVILFVLTLCACDRDASLNLQSSDIPAIDNSTTVAASQINYCATAIVKGFADDIKVSVYVDAQGNILSVTSENHETAGLGTRAVEEMGKAMMRENSEFIDAVSGATISSLAFRKAAGEAYMVAYAKSQGMVCSASDNPMVGVWRWDSNDEDFEKVFWLIYPNGLFVPYSVERNENMVSLQDVHQDERNIVYYDSTLSLVRDDDVAESLPIEWIDRDHFSLPDEGEFYYSATRVQIDGEINADTLFPSDNEDSNQTLEAVRELDDSDWEQIRKCIEFAEQNVQRGGYAIFDTYGIDFDNWIDTGIGEGYIAVLSNPSLEEIRLNFQTVAADYLSAKVIDRAMANLGDSFKMIDGQIYYIPGPPYMSINIDTCMLVSAENGTYKIFAAYDYDPVDMDSGKNFTFIWQHGQLVLDGDDNKSIDNIGRNKEGSVTNTMSPNEYFKDVLLCNDIIEDGEMYFADAFQDKEYTYERALARYTDRQAYDEANVGTLHQVDRLDDVLYLPVYSGGDIPTKRVGHVYIVPPGSPSHTFNLEFRGICSGMDKKALYKALGLSDTGIAYADATPISEFWISDNGCYDAVDVYEFVKEETRELPNDKMIVLAYKNTGFVSFLLRNDFLYSVQLCKATYR